MTCKKCSYILYGSENYCPHCGEKRQTEEEQQIKKEEADPKPIFISRETFSDDSNLRGRIFQPEPPLEDVSDFPKEKPQRKEKSSSRGVIAFLSVLCLLLLGTAIFTAMDYFDIAPAVADFLSQRETTAESSTEPSNGEFASSFGTISPQINYAPVNCVVSSANSISLRKGPSDSYGQISSLQSGSEVQVIGGSADSKNWVYVYVTAEDLYGWVSASFISGELPVSEEEKTTDEKNK